MSTHSGYIWSRLIHIRGLRAVVALLFTGGIFAAIAASIHLPGLNVIDHTVTHDLQIYRSSAADALFQILDLGVSVVGTSAVPPVPGMLKPGRDD